jgi:hypothetical protein
MRQGQKFAVMVRHLDIGRDGETEQKSAQFPCILTCDMGLEQLMDLIKGILDNYVDDKCFDEENPAFMVLKSRRGELDAEEIGA